MRIKLILMSLLQLNTDDGLQRKSVRVGQGKLICRPVITAL